MNISINNASMIGSTQISSDTLVTIIALCYNHEKFLLKSIQSILNQTHTNIELFLVDDCSSDKSLQIAKQFNDERITILKHEFNKGINRGIEDAAIMSKGSYIMLIATDDLLTSTCVEDSLYEIANSEILFQNLSFINYHGKPVASAELGITQEKDKFKALNKMFFKENCFYSPGMMIKRDAFIRILPLDNSISLFQDYKINVKLLIEHDYKVSNLKNVIYRLPSENSGISFVNDKTIIASNLQQKALMDAFLSIPTVELLKKIFGNSIDKYQSLPDRAVPFILGMIALDSDNLYKRLWGYNVVSDFINNYENYELLNKKLAFSYKDFLQLCSFFTVDQINGYMTNGKYLKKYRKYKKISKILLIVLLFSLFVGFLLFLI